MKNEPILFIMKGRKQRRTRWLFVTGLLIILLCLLCCAMLILGNTIYPVKKVIHVLLGEQLQGATFAIQTIRLPRLLSGLFAGFSYVVAGFIFSLIFCN